MTIKLNEKERSEPMMVTWGRVLTQVRYYQDNERLKALLEKLNEDFKNAKVIEGFFQTKTWQDLDK